LRTGIALLAVGVAATATAAAIAGSAKNTAVSKIAIATPAKANDYGWNQQGAAAARAAGKAYGATVTVQDGVGYDNTQAVLLRLARSGNDFVIAQASGYNTIAPRVAQQTKVPMIGYDNPKNLVKDYYSDIETSSQDGAYLAGVLAGKTTTANKLGIVISAADTNWYKQAGGFVAGARSVNPDVTFRFAQVGQAAYDDAAGGKRVMQATIAAGADIVFGMGDGATLGYLQAVETSKKKVWFIDVIGNPTPIDKKGAVLSSVLWDFSKVFKQAIADINAGRYGEKFYTLGLNNGVSLLRTKHISGANWALVKEARKGIINGSIKVPLTPDKKSVTALMK
jgi:simple sugar transport system substrate-binding protein